MRSRALTVAVVLLGWVLPASAQQSVRLEFNAGKVTLSARNAPVRAILAEWARLGGATIVNGDRVAGQPVTLELTSVPERQALDIVLRDVSGYMIAPRPAGSNGASLFDRIMILPTSTAPRPVPAVTATRPAGQRPTILARPPQPGNEIDQAAIEEADNSVGSQGGGPGDPRSRTPIQQRLPADEQSEEAEQPNDDVPVVKPTPTNPFGIPPGSSATPGIVTPLPQRPGPARVQ
jgi:hypothetical protein